MKQHLPQVKSLALWLGLAGFSGGVLGQGAAGSNDAMLLLLEQNRNLQAEVQALRGLVEEQGYEIRRLQRESLDRYTDTDGRLRSLEQAIAGGGLPVGPAAGNAVSALPDTATGSPEEVNTIPPVQSDPFTAAGGTTVDPMLPEEGITDAGQITQPAAEPLASRSVGVRPTLEPGVLTEQQLYQMAYDSAINSQFERAIGEFDQYLAIYPSGRFTTNAHYWKGQSYLYLSRYNEAIAEYAIILNQYPNDAKVPDAMYGQAVAFEGTGDVQRARRLLQQIMRSYPNTGVANLADTRLRSLN